MRLPIWARAAMWGAAMLAPLVGACRGSGELQLVTLNYRAVDPPEPRPFKMRLQECYWWTEPDGRLWIAFRHSFQPLFLPKFRLEFEASLVLDKLPAGRARDYRMSQQTLRAAARFGPSETRFSSLVGIMALYQRGGGRLAGSMRLEAAGQSMALLTGWTRPSRYLLLGQFEAVRDERRGRAIAARTEEGGFERAAPDAGTPAGRDAGPASLQPDHQPATLPSSSSSTSERAPDAP